MTFFGLASALLLIAASLDVGYFSISNTLADWHIMGVLWAVVAAFTLRRVLSKKGYRFDDKGSQIGYVCAFLMLMTPGVILPFTELSASAEIPIWAQYAFSSIVIIGFILTAGLGGISGKKVARKL